MVKYTHPVEFDRWADNFINNSGRANLVKDQKSAQELLSAYMRGFGEITPSMKDAMQKEVIPRILQKLKLYGESRVETPKQKKFYREFKIKSDGVRQFERLGKSKGRTVYARETEIKDKKTGKIKIVFRDRKGRIVKLDE